MFRMRWQTFTVEVARDKPASMLPPRRPLKLLWKQHTRDQLQRNGASCHINGLTLRAVMEKELLDLSFLFFGLYQMSYPSDWVWIERQAAGLL
jgi:hypothetical protein